MIPADAAAALKESWSQGRAERAARTFSHGLAAMPSLIRLLVVVGVIFGLVYGAMYALATMVDPKTREMVVTVPPDRFVKQQR
jgi:hypothetical protein